MLKLKDGSRPLRGGIPVEEENGDDGLIVTGGPGVGAHRAGWNVGAAVEGFVSAETPLRDGGAADGVKPPTTD